ncbi:hypothetical protein NEHOM01_0381 [Nematocida homosporus]|uniref:uncharacterized protein n=1 Tax=Nematocida homosporus TaxID=1912981 RepID=UPI00221E38AD|nr:uncharacterized protein NEHOM01_0381 [Nematocida homosporus]KAI5184779.1 hypothetical protein NEHOM01_0381 [Nematocida homosporus]
MEGDKINKKRIVMIGIVGGGVVIVSALLYYIYSRWFSRSMEAVAMPVRSQRVRGKGRSASRRYAGFNQDPALTNPIPTRPPSQYPPGPYSTPASFEPKPAPASFEPIPTPVSFKPIPTPASFKPNPTPAPVELNPSPAPSERSLSPNPSERSLSPNPSERSLSPDQMISLRTPPIYFLKPRKLVIPNRSPITVKQIRKRLDPQYYDLFDSYLVPYMFNNNVDRAPCTTSLMNGAVKGLYNIFSAIDFDALRSHSERSTWIIWYYISQISSPLTRLKLATCSSATLKLLAAEEHAHNALTKGDRTPTKTWDLVFKQFIANGRRTFLLSPVTRPPALNVVLHRYYRSIYRSHTFKTSLEAQDRLDSLLLVEKLSDWLEILTNFVHITNETLQTIYTTWNGITIYSEKPVDRDTPLVENPLLQAAPDISKSLVSIINECLMFANHFNHVMSTFSKSTPNDNTQSSAMPSNSTKIEPHASAIHVDMPLAEIENILVSVITEYDQNLQPYYLNS